jgi:hypothetical protein
MRARGGIGDTCMNAWQNARVGVLSDRRQSAGLCFALLTWATAAWATMALGGCGANDGAGTFLVDPGRYTAYHCDDLAARWKVLKAREKELSGLMDKASESSGGAVVGSLAYRTDYETVMSEEKLLQRTATEKSCSFTPNFQSDQTVR